MVNKNQLMSDVLLEIRPINRSELNIKKVAVTIKIDLIICILKFFFKFNLGLSIKKYKHIAIK